MRCEARGYQDNTAFLRQSRCPPRRWRGPATPGARNMTKQVTKRCRRPIGHLGCNRLSANEINTSVDVPPASVQRNHNSRTTRATVLGFAPNARPRLVCSVSETTTYGGIALGFTRYYFPFARREGLANSHGRGKTCLFSWDWLAAGLGLVARLPVHDDAQGPCRRRPGRPDHRRAQDGHVERDDDGPEAAGHFRHNPSPPTRGRIPN